MKLAIDGHKLKAGLEAVRRAAPAFQRSDLPHNAALIEYAQELGDDFATLKIVTTNSRWLAEWTARVSPEDNVASGRFLVNICGLLEALDEVLEHAAFGQAVTLELSTACVAISVPQHAATSIASNADAFPDYEKYVCVPTGRGADITRVGARYLADVAASFVDAASGKDVSLQVRNSGAFSPIYVSSPDVPELAVWLMPMRLSAATAAHDNRCAQVSI